MIPIGRGNCLTSHAAARNRAPVKLVEHVEGRTRLLVPEVSLRVDPPPTSPVFFNPAASLNRDVSVCLTAASDGSTFCDSMAGVGARGLRVAVEVGRMERVVLVDFNRRALKVAREAGALNRVLRKCVFAESETSSYLYSRYGRERRFDYVDVDPFGTPVAQLQGAVSATADGGILSLTATDTAVLCGVYPKVARRRYGATPLNNQFRHETAIRLLAGTVARIAGALDIGVRPAAAHSTKHYARLYLSINAGATKAESAMTNLGHVTWCPSCGHTAKSAEKSVSCGRCGKKARSAGPLWLGPLTDEELLRKARGVADRSGFKRASETFAALLGVDDFPPWSFSVDDICSALRVPTAAESEVYRNLKQMGHRAMRTPFEKAGLKTSAEHAEVLQAVAASAGTSERRTGVDPARLRPRS
jgi:tRNA (guanine26-N2/guanine27-N2)-dimethyltransferase